MPALFKRSSPPTPAEPEPDPLVEELDGFGRPRKDRPTPSRRAAEAARRERLRPTLSKKEARRRTTQANRSERLKAVATRDATPEKTLMRDYIDSRRNLAEFLLPSVLIIIALTFLNAYIPQITFFTTLALYLFIATVLLDAALMWRGFKRLSGERLPTANRRGLLMYGVNRSMQIRRLRVPPPRVKRGEPI